MTPADQLRFWLAANTWKYDPETERLILDAVAALDAAKQRAERAEAAADRLAIRLEKATLGCRDPADIEAFRLYDEAVAAR